MIREAILDDVPELVALGRRFLAESPYSKVLPDNPAQIAETFSHLIEQETSTMLVAADGRALTGMIGLLCFVHHFSGALVCAEVVYWCDPSVRGATGVKLLKAAERWATRQGAALMQVSAPEGAERVEALYRACRYVPLERAFQRVLA